MTGRARLAEILEQGWGIAALTQVETLKADRVWRVTAEGGRSYVLKNWGALDAGLEERVRFHQDVMRHVGERGVAGERALISASGGAIHRHAGEAWWVTVPLPNHPTELAPGDYDELQRNYGRAIGGLHAALATFPEADARRRTWRKDLHAEVAAGLSTIRARLAGGERARFEALVAPVEGELERLRGLPEQLIFFDCHHGNVLRDGARVTGFVDANHLSIGLRIWDLLSMMSQALGGLRPADVAAWARYDRLLLDAYDEVNPLTSAERGAIWAGLLALKLDQLAWWLGRGDPPDVIMLQIERLVAARPLLPG